MKADEAEYEGEGGREYGVETGEGKMTGGGGVEGNTSGS